MHLKAGTWLALARAAALGAAGLHLAAFASVAVARLVYPYELDWVEGGLADEVSAILRGQMPYAAPSLQRVAFIYPPLYFYLSAAAAALLGAGSGPVGFWLPRAVSLAATLAIFALIYALVRQAGARRAAGLLAVGVFAATFKIGGEWLLLARVDALFLALFLAGAYALQRARGRAGYMLAGALLALSLLTKQTALLMTAPLAAYAVVADRRRGWLLGATFAALAVAAGAWFNWASQGWFGYYVLNGANSQPLRAATWLIYFGQTWLRPLALLLLAGLGYLALQWRARRPVLLWAALLAGTAGSGLWVLLRVGAAQNNLLPAYAALAVLGGLALDQALTWAAGRPGLARVAAPVLIYGLCVWQLAQLAYNPLLRMPDDHNRQAGAALVRRLALAPGDVYLPQHGVVAGLAGKPAFAHLAAVEDVLNTGGPPAAQLLDDLRAALRQRRFAAILVDGDEFTARFPELQQNYRVAETLSAGAGFYSLDRLRIVPEDVYVPR